MMSSVIPQAPRSPMKSLDPRENIPFPTQPSQKSKQLGIEAFTKKRELENFGISNPNPPIKKLKTETGELIPVVLDPDRKTLICHQCRQHIYTPLSVQCTVLKKRMTIPEGTRCRISYCYRCLSNRYNEKTKAILSHHELQDGHVHDAGYTWACPKCRGICDCSLCRKKMQLNPLETVKGSTSKDMEEKPVKRQGKNSAENGIASFFKKPEVDRVTPESAIIPDGFTAAELKIKQFKPKPAVGRKVRKPAVKVIDPPAFHAVRATTNDTGFFDRLKIREFVLQFAKIFTRKLHVPMKHIAQLADPCDTLPSLTIKHLYVALLKIIQIDITDQEIQDQTRETLRLVEKSASGNENILTATIEWLTYMDPKHPPPSDEIGVASQLIDWATATTVCRDELDANIEKLKLLKSENATAMKTLRSEWEEKKGELHKERLRIVEKDLVDQWKTSLADLDKEYKSETLQLSNELWSESRRLSPRTMSLGTDILGNKYWIFSSRKTKEREFGGWVVIQTPDNKFPTGEPTDDTTTTDDPDEYRDLKSWYYVEKPEDVRQLAQWAMHLVAKATFGDERKVTTPKGSPNKLGQTFAVEISSPKVMKERPGKGPKVVELAGLVDTRVLCEELTHAANWIEERYNEPYDYADNRWPEVEEEKKEEVVIDGEIIVLDP